MPDTMESLAVEVRRCENCPLAAHRTHAVPGVGNPSTRVLLVGEGPGRNEDEQGEPFVGRSGQLMDKMLRVVDLDRSRNIYITNIVKCRPPENRDPLPEESAACLPFLTHQIAAMQPKIILCVGRISAMQLIRPDFKITREHGQWFLKDGIWMMGTLHPAALLRNPNQKPQALEDLLALREKILEVCPEVYAL